MRVHTQDFKDQIKKLGREIDSKITYGNKVLTSEELYGVYPIINGSLLKSAMKELHFESSTQIPNNVIIKYEFGLKVNNEYEYLNYGNYIVYSSEFNEDTKTYKHTCYDGMLFSMRKYKNLQNGTFPMTVREYITNLCLDCNLIFKNFNDKFPNYDKIIESDLYANLDYTYRDIFDELSAVTASTICLNSSEQVEVRYITETNDTIDAEYLKDVNVKFGAKYGPINSIVLSRSAESDNVYLRDEESVIANGLCELKIIDNQIMNDNDRSNYLPDILAKLNGLEYHINDYTSTGILYYEICDKYKIQLEDKIYTCILLNDEPEITQGIVENVFTEMLEETVTDYSKADKTDRKINQAFIIVDKQNQKITAIAETQEEHSSKIAKLEMTDESITQSVNTINNQIIPTSQVSGSYIHLEDSASAPLINLEIEGKSEQNGTPTPDTPIEIKSVGYANLFDFEMFKNENSASITGDADNFKLSVVDQSMKYYFGEENKHYTISGTWYSTRRDGVLNIYYTDGSRENIIAYYDAISQDSTNFRFTTSKNKTVDYIKFTTYSGNFTFEHFMISEGTQEKSCIPHGKYGIEVEIVGKNLFDKGKLEQNGISTTGEEIDNAYIVRTDFIKVLNNVDYILSFDFNSTIGYDVRVFQYDSNKKFLKFDYTNTTKLNFKTETNAAYIRLSFYTDRQITPITYLNHFSNIQLEQNKTSTNYEEYKSSTTQFILEQPLRSLPNGVKDIAYITNNKLYIDRKVGNIVLSGSENWSAEGSTNNCYRYYIKGLFTVGSRENAGMSNRFKYIVDYGGTEPHFYLNTGGTHYFFSTISTLVGFKTWLSEHPTQVDYELSEPYTEELGEIEMPSTFIGITNISTTDDLEPIINIEYVRDTTLSSYVEGQLQNERVIRKENIAQLIIENNRIKESVQTVSGSVDGLNTTVNSATDTLTSQGRLLEIVSTNIDKSTGEVREVTTTTGFTFNAKGMIISDDGGFKGEHTAQGTFYKDGETITGQYTKDGSKQKDLELFGTYSYGKENIDDTPMFIAQLYKDENGEECFGHFYNGGGY